MVRKDDPQFLAVVNETLGELYRSGEINGIYQRWFEQPIPGQGINLKLPMSDALKAVVQRPLDSADPEDYRRLLDDRAQASGSPSLSPAGR